MRTQRRGEHAGSSADFENARLAGAFYGERRNAIRDRTVDEEMLS